MERRQHFVCTFTKTQEIKLCIQGSKKQTSKHPRPYYVKDKFTQKHVYIYICRLHTTYS